MTFVLTKKTTEDTDEMEGFRKRFQKWSLLKTHRYENAPFLVWRGENGAFENSDEKKKSYSVDSKSVFVRLIVSTIAENKSKSIRFSDENALEWADENKLSLALFSLRRKCIRLKNH